MDNRLNQEMLLNMFDITLLKPLLEPDEIEKFIEQCRELQPKGVCVHPVNISRVVRAMQGIKTIVASVVGFPAGANLSRTKVFEAECAVNDGASEIDMVINLTWLRNRQDKFVENEIRQVVKIVGDVSVKVIIEAPILQHDEKIRVCKLAANAGAKFIKTCSGYSSNWADPEDVSLIKANIPEQMQIKASGKVDSLERVQKLIQAGASRFGLLLIQAINILKEVD